MKFLIWSVCLLVLSIVQTAIRAAGITLGGLPTVILASLIVFVPAPILCRKWEERRELRDTIRELGENKEKVIDGSQSYTVIPAGKKDLPEASRTDPSEKTHAETPRAAPEGRPSSAKAMFCRRCGASLLPDSSFCGKCGTRIEM